MKVNAPNLPKSIVQVIVPALSDADKAGYPVLTERDIIPFKPIGHRLKKSFFPAFGSDLVKKRVRDYSLICCFP